MARKSIAEIISVLISYTLNEHTMYTCTMRPAWSLLNRNSGVPYTKWAKSLWSQWETCSASISSYQNKPLELTLWKVVRLWTAWTLVWSKPSAHWWWIERKAYCSHSGVCYRGSCWLWSTQQARRGCYKCLTLYILQQSSSHSRQSSYSCQWHWCHKHVSLISQSCGWGQPRIGTYRHCW